MEGDRFRALSARQRALVAVAVLLDGIEAGNYLENDATQGKSLKLAASDLASQPIEMRMPLVGTLLRVALEEMA